MPAYRCTNAFCANLLDPDASDNLRRCPRCGSDVAPLIATQSGFRTASLDGGESPAPLTGPGTLGLDANGRASSSPPTADLVGGNYSDHSKTRPAEVVSHTIGRFQILSSLGEGAFGVVYRAYDPQLEREVALKVAKPGSLDTPARKARFLREAKATAILRHPHIVPLYESGAEGDQLYLCSALIDGNTLEAVMGNGLKAVEAATIVRRLAEALAYAHSVGVIHRDVKPQNVLLDAKREPHLTDFGLALRPEPGSERLTGDHVALGTPAYMAPEQADGEGQPASDQYSLGCTLYEMLTGSTPYAGGAAQQVFLHKTQPPVSPRTRTSNVPRDLETICLKCLSKDPANRYRDCGELAEDLRRFLAGEPTLARPPGPVERFIKWSRRSPYQAATVVVSFVSLVAVALLAVAWASAEEDRLKEANRLRGQEKKFAEHYARGQASAEKEDWPDARNEFAQAVSVVESEPAMTGHELYESAQLRLRKARERLTFEADRKQARTLPEQLNRHYSDAVFYATTFSGLEPVANREHARKAIHAGLALFGVEVNGSGPPTASEEFFTASERVAIENRCYELLLLEADLLSRVDLGEQQTKVFEQWREAIKRIDRAERLSNPPRPSYSGELLRVRLHRQFKEPKQEQAARERSERVPSRLAADSMSEAIVLYNQNQFLKAIERLSEVLRTDPDHFGAQTLRAVCYLREGQFREAKEGFTRLLRDRDLGWIRLLRADAEIGLARLLHVNSKAKSSDPKAAKDELEKIWKNAEDDLEHVMANPGDDLGAYYALMHRGNYRFQRERWAEAEADYAAAIRLQPRSVNAHLNLAQALGERGRLSFAERVNLHLLPNSAVTVAAVDFFEFQSRAKQLDALNRGLRDFPTHPLLARERARLLQSLGDLEGAEADFRTAIGSTIRTHDNLRYADDCIALGQLLVRRKEYDKAIVLFTDALNARGDRKIAHRFQAIAYLQLGDYKKAGAELDEYLRSLPPEPTREPGREATLLLARDTHETLRMRGMIFEEQAKAFEGRAMLHERSKYAEHLRSAIECYSQGMKFARTPELLTQRGWAYLASGAPELALADFEEALKIGSPSADALIGRAGARGRLDKPSEAAIDAEAGVLLAGGDSRLLYNAARAFAQIVPPIPKETPIRIPKPTPETVFHSRCERRAVELLRQVLVSKPVTERADFWKRYVKEDKAFDSIRNGGAMLFLAREFDQR